MNRKKTKIVSSIAILAAALVFLIYSAIEGTALYYLTVSEFKAKLPELASEGVRVTGRVVQGSIKRSADLLTVEFLAADPLHPEDVLTVSYTGVTPDTFTDGSEVVVEGEYTQAGFFKATTLFAKCPSKYEPLQGSEKNS